MAASFERTGGKRYPKTLLFTKNMDVLDSLLSSDDEQYSKLLLSWIGLGIASQARFETALLQLLVNLSEEAVYKLVDNERDIIFNMNSVYSKLLAGRDAVDIDDTKEAKGPLRILKSSLSEKMNPFLLYSRQGGENVVPGADEKLRAYSKRVNTYLSLTNAKHIITTETQPEAVEDAPNVPEIPDTPRIKGGKNVILYGVPGSGKSHTVGKQ